MGKVDGVGLEDRVVGLEVGVLNLGGAESEDGGWERGVVFVVCGG